MKIKSSFPIIIILGIVLVAIFSLVTNPNALLLHPHGAIALAERNLAIVAVLIMLIIVVPTLFFLVLVVLRYREGNKSAQRNSNWERSKHLVFLWWALPTVIILILAVINWKSTHALDPFRPVTSHATPLTIQVVALQWKWLFIYPEQNIATINFIQFPEHTPINFELSAEAPMSSFWIPQLGGQMYAMTGMGTKLHLIADRTGDFEGSAAEINGIGFAGMRFIARSSDQNDFNEWVATVKKSDKNLDYTEYQKLVRPTEKNSVVYYSAVEEGLYNRIIMKYTMQEMNGDK